MKAQQEVITYILITAVMIIVISSAYIWGSSIVERNRDVTLLNRAEKLMKDLNNKIKNVANSGGRDSIYIDFGVFSFENGIITFFLETRATIYEPGKRIYFIKNQDCHYTGSCILGRDEPEIFYVYSRMIDKNYYTTYFLTYRELVSPQDGSRYLIVLNGEKLMGTGSVIIENMGRVFEDGVAKTIINIRLA